MNPNPYLPPQSSPEPPVLALLVGEDGGISVDFAIELEDVIAFSVYHSMRSPRGHKQFLNRWLLIGVSAAIVLVGMVYIMYVQGMLLDLFPAVILTAAVAVAYIGFYPWIYARRLRNASEAVIRSGRNLAVFGPRRITLTPQFVMHSSPYTQSATRWIAMERVDPQPEALYLYVSSNSAHIVPRRPFASDDDFRTFIQTAQQFHALALATEHPQRTLA
jgi:uncharacterized membrane protein